MHEKPEPNPVTQLWSSSPSEYAASLMYHAPAWVRTLRPITAADSTDNIPAGFVGWEPVDPDLEAVLLPTGSVAQATVTPSGRVRVTLPDGTARGFLSHLFHADRYRPGEQAMEFIEDDEYLEMLYDLGGWRCADGLKVTITREDGPHVTPEDRAAWQAEAENQLADRTRPGS